MMSTVHTITTQNLDNVQSLIESHLGNCGDYHSYKIDITLTVNKRPSSVLAPLTPAEIQNVVNMDFSVYEDVLQLNNSVFTLNKRELHQRILNLYASTVKNISDIIHRLRYMLTLPKFNLLKSLILDDLDDFLLAHPSYLTTTNTQPTLVRIPLIPLQIPTIKNTLASSSSIPTPIFRASHSRPPKEIHLRDYGYQMKSSKSTRQQCLDRAIEAEGITPVLHRVNFLKNHSKSQAIMEDFDYITSTYLSQTSNSE
jgi:hypothetical protein